VHAQPFRKRDDIFSQSTAVCGIDPMLKRLAKKVGYLDDKSGEFG